MPYKPRNKARARDGLQLQVDRLYGDIEYLGDRVRELQRENELSAIQHIVMSAVLAYVIARLICKGVIP